MVDRHRFLLLELHECYSTYLMRREQMAEALDQLRIHHQSTEASPQHDSHTAGLKLVCLSAHLFLCLLLAYGIVQQRVKL